MMESNVPILGAVMNMVNPSSASVYSMNYYDKSYQNYYTTPPDIEDEDEESVPPGDIPNDGDSLENK